ncbi:MAG: NADH-quinone oxidoreductase subunit N [Methanobacteriota archaeon]|nr:MAG: NADH-quinone oxidoreductase subunit N [Euryarchaeota archaeon]
MMPISVTSSDMMSILPVIILSVFGIYLMLQGVLAPRFHQASLLYIALLGILAAAISNLFLIGDSYTAFSDMIKVDRLTVAFNFIFLFTAALTLLMVSSYSEQESMELVEFTPLLLFSTVGMMLMGSAENLMTLFLGLETMSIALYVMAGFRRYNRLSLEAALKYFLLGAFATGFLLYGIALLYGVVGSANLKEIAQYFSQNTLNADLIALAGMGLIIVGFGFKVALVPFHMWTPDVYQGAPIPVTAYMAVGAKAAGFAAILRVIVLSAGSISFHWTEVLWILAVLTMTVGNIIALVQDNIKRMLAYSSIAHAGYILMAVVASNELSAPSVLFYLIVYMFMNIGAFAIASVVGGEGERWVKIKDFAGLGRTQPMLGLAMTIFMFSLAGFPPTGGFMGKLYIFTAALESGYIWLVIFGAINTLLSVYYYIGVVVAMYMQKPTKEVKIKDVLPGVGLVILLAVIGVVYFGIFPGKALAMLY